MKKFLPFMMIPLISYGMSIDEAVQKAIQQNIQIQIQKKEIEKSRHMIKEDKNLFMPEFFFDFSFTSLKDTPYMTVPAGAFPFPFSFKQSQKDFKNIEFGINYYIFTGLSRVYKLNISKLQLKSSKEDFNETVNQIKAETKKAYLNVLMAKAVVEVYRSQLKAVQKHLYRVKEFYKEGLVTKIDILQTKVKLSEIKRNLRKAEGDLKVAKAYLNNILNEDIDSDFSVEDVKINIPEKIDLNYLYSKALENRNIIKSIRYRKRQIENLEKIYISEFLPKLFAQAKYFWTDQNPYLDPKGNYALTLGVIWKFQGLKPKYAALQRKTEISQTRLKLKQIENGIILEVKKAYENFQTAKENYNVALSSLEEAKEYYRLVVEQFKNQLSTTTDVLDAESALTSAKKGKEISYYRLLQAFVDLEKAVGGSLK
ncbi:Outer membrane protein TolC [Persephonella hydrogeniphila]|uniref:Outer membrane protein TolC n=1 Tax=Persephonella hydrogeniphila TaxID=198703 RepID=A0A285N0E2_9AQUI|nr:TolC family protein [Persephonella hydrogeniphila]SNZ02924.1 Outer membrane protein TolC [Persephonella hydrogeniphila]